MHDVSGVIDLNNAVQGVLTIVVSVIGFLLVKLWKIIEDLPEKYVPRKEQQERQLRIEEMVRNMESNISRINGTFHEMQSDLKKTLERIFDKIEDSK